MSQVSPSYLNPSPKALNLVCQGAPESHFRPSYKPFQTFIPYMQTPTKTQFAQDIFSQSKILMRNPSKARHATLKWNLCRIPFRKPRLHVGMYVEHSRALFQKNRSPKQRMPLTPNPRPQTLPRKPSCPK